MASPCGGAQFQVSLAIDNGGMLQVWYWATPLFALLDWVTGFSGRVAALESASVRALYYGACVICALALWLRPRWAPVVALTESSLNIGLLLVTTASAILSAPQIVAEGGAVDLMTPARLFNFLAVGLVLLVAVQTAIAQLRAGPRGITWSLR